MCDASSYSLPGRNTVFIPRLCDGTLSNQLPCGVEFSGSSGDPSSPESLLYLSPTGVNEYLTALWGVRGVILDYDSDKLFPAFGFEAQVPLICRCPMNLP